MNETIHAKIAALEQKKKEGSIDEQMGFPKYAYNQYARKWLLVAHPGDYDEMILSKVDIK